MEFCTRLANQLMLKKVEEHEEKNSVVSPVSINAVLNMVAAGSKGATLDHFFALLGSKMVKEINSESAKMMAVAADVGLNSPNKGTEDNDDIGLVLAMVNGAWFDQRFPLKPSYGEDILKGIFNCEAKTVHFATQADQVVDFCGSNPRLHLFSRQGAVFSLLKSSADTQSPPEIFLSMLWSK